MGKDINKSLFIRTDEQDDEKDIIIPNYTAQTESVSSDTGRRVSANYDILKLVPDIHQARRILNASIISPKDLSASVTLSYSFDKLFLPSTIEEELKSVIKDEMENVYDLSESVHDMVDKTFITEGAYVTLFYNIDTAKNLIYNYATKTSKRQPDLIEYKTYKEITKLDEITDVEVLAETFDTVVDEYFSITTNIKDIKTEHEIVEATIEADTEKKVNYNKIFSRLLYETEEDYELVENEQTNKIARCGKIQVPTEACIPITFKNDVSKHLEYYILLDENGLPIKQRVSSEKLKSIRDKLNHNLITYSDKPPTIDNIDNIFNRKIKEFMMLDRFKSITSESTLSEVMNTMIYRALSAKKTKILIVPASNVNYMAVNYRENGTGESLLENVTVLASLYGATYYTRISAMIEAGSPETLVDATLFDDDPNPSLTMKRIMKATESVYSRKLPTGILKMTDFVDWKRTSGLTYRFHHKAIPETVITKEVGSNQITVPSDDVEVALIKRIFITLGIPYDFIEQSSSSDLATRIVANNALFRSYIAPIQRKMNVNIANYVRKHVKFDTLLRTKLIDVLHLNRKELRKLLGDDAITNDEAGGYLVDYIMDRLKVELPSVTFQEDSALGDAFDAYSQRVEDYVDKVYDPISEEIGENADTLKNAIKYKLYTTWLTKNNFMTEILTIFKKDGEDEIHNNVLLEYSHEINKVIDGFNEYLKDKKRVDKKLDKQSTIADEPEDEPEEPTEPNEEETEPTEPKEPTEPEESEEDIKF